MTNAEKLERSVEETTARFRKQFLRELKNRKTIVKKIVDDLNDALDANEQKLFCWGGEIIEGPVVPAHKIRLDAIKQIADYIGLKQAEKVEYSGSVSLELAEKVKAARERVKNAG